MTRDRAWIFVYALVVMLVTMIPYLTAYTIVRLNPSYSPQWEFTGFVLGVEDGNSYIAKELIGSAGNWLFRTPYTSTPQSGVIAFLPYILLGKLASPPGLHIQLVALFHLFRFIAGVLAIIATYDFLTLFIKNPFYLKMGVVLATIGGGLGWLWLLLGRETVFGSIPLEFYSPEAFGFLGLYGLPHGSLARAFFLWGLRRYLLIIQKDSYLVVDWVWIGVFWLIVAIAQPITAIVFGIVFGIYNILVSLKQLVDVKRTNSGNWPRCLRGLKVGFLSGLIPAPFLIYNYIKFTTDNYLITWTQQNLIISPHFFHFLSAYGLMLPLAVFGGIFLYRKSSDFSIFLGGWIFAFPILAYFPIGVQRRLLEGEWVSIVTLATCGMLSLESRLPRKSLRRLFTLLTACSVISTVLIIALGILAVLTPKQPVYRPSEQIKAFEFIALKSNPGEVVLTSYQTGNALPAWADVRVIIGHGPESANLEALRVRVREFFSSTGDDQQRIEFIRAAGIRYIFWGPDERGLGGLQPSTKSYLRLIYQSTNYEIYQTTLSP